MNAMVGPPKMRMQPKLHKIFIRETACDLRGRLLLAVVDTRPLGSRLQNQEPKLLSPAVQGNSSRVRPIRHFHSLRPRSPGYLAA